MLTYSNIRPHRLPAGGDFREAPAADWPAVDDQVIAVDEALTGDGGVKRLERHAAEAAAHEGATGIVDEQVDAPMTLHAVATPRAVRPRPARSAQRSAARLPIVPRSRARPCLEVAFLRLSYLF